MLSNKEIVCPNNLLNAAHKKKGVKAGIVNEGKLLQMLSFQDLCIGCFVEKREHWMKYSGIFYFSTFTYDEQKDKKACYKSLQHKLYIDNCDFLVVQSNNPTGISLEIYNYLKNTTKLGIKNKL